MGLSVIKILAILTVVVFVLLMLFSKSDKNRLYIQYVILTLPFSNISLAPLGDVFDIITVGFALTVFRKRDVQLFNGTIYNVLFVLLIAAIIIGLALNQDFSGDMVEGFVGVLSTFAFAKILIDEILYDTDYFYKVVNYLKVPLVFSFIFLAGQVAFGVENVRLFKTMNPNIMLANTIRYPSFLGDPQAYSQFLAALSFICLIKDHREEKFNKLNYLLVIGSLVAILMAGGRAGLLGWGVGMALVVFFGNASYRFAVVVAVIGLYVISVNFQDSFSMFKRGGDMGESYEFRNSIWSDALTIFQKYPFFGIGMDGYADYVARHHPDQVWIVENEPIYFDHPESGYLKFLTELGAVGFISIFGLILIPMIRSFIYYLVSKETSLILIIAGIGAWMVGFYSTYTLGDNRIQLMIVVMLCLLITSRQRLAAIYDESLHENDLPVENEKIESPV